MKQVSFAPTVDVVLETSDEFGQVYRTEKCKALLEHNLDEEHEEDLDMIMIPYLACAYELFNAIPGAPMFPKKKTSNSLVGAMKKKEEECIISSKLTVEMSKRARTKAPKTKRGLQRRKLIPGRETPEQMKQRLADQSQKTVFEKFAQHERNQMIAQHDAEHAEIVAGPVFLIPADLDGNTGEDDDDFTSMDSSATGSKNFFSHGDETRDTVIVDSEMSSFQDCDRRERRERPIDFSARKWALSSSPELERADAVQRKSKAELLLDEPSQIENPAGTDNSITCE